MKILLELRFLGSAYHGWQVQRAAPSVQKTLQSAAETLLGVSCAVTGCSRTDAGVHARQYFCTLECSAPGVPPLQRLPTALNALLPPDIAVIAAREVPDDFHPRYAAKAKEYEYLIDTAPLRDAFLANRAWALGQTPDLTLMQREAMALCGTHDFTSFCASGGKIQDKTRTVYFCTVRKKDDLISLRVCANGFLYNMVRIIAGTLVECGLGRKKDCAEILAAHNRSKAGRTAPAHGLYLDRVYYSEEELNERIQEIN